ncbi:MAG TPA: decarboxylating 6-phosphogluconate dehydrogenase, partial [Candidatus Polarisedimenticolaceae bacterium]|nr:decarboxylating 6-phosphogluconate dehydrogenase [Candidatus Polarisedimenticolaceae bacterium]
MQLGMVGLGRMGLNMAVRLLRRGHQVVGTARGKDAFPTLEKEGGKAVPDLAGLVRALATPRTVWVMVPAGAPTQAVLDDLRQSLEPGDLVVDGGNSRYTDSVARAQTFAARKIGFVDAGTSGGVWGLENGYCMMVGGAADDVARLTPVLRDLAPPDGYLHTGPAGSGHYCKMVHNGIEYGMLQAYGEGFEILARSGYTFDLAKVAHLWNQGSVVRSWLLELAERALGKDARLESIRGYVEDSGEGRWTVQEAIDHNVPAQVIVTSLLTRFRSRQDDSYTAKVLAALRNQFGGHA